MHPEDADHRGWSALETGDPDRGLHVELFELRREMDQLVLVRSKRGAMCPGPFYADLVCALERATARFDGTAECQNVRVADEAHC